MSLRVLVIGGYGTFGARLVQLLAGEPGLEIIVAGRSLASAQALCGSAASLARLIPAQFDRNGDVLAQMRALEPALVVDASGPFQHYGPRPYRVVEAALALGVHYLDLADATGFVCGIGQFDGAARRAGVFVLSGVSSVPVLNMAAARAMSADLASVDSLSAGIAPSPMVRIGLNVVRSIAGEAGKRFNILRDGMIRPAFGLMQSRRFTIAPPGCLPLPSIHFAVVDTPDRVLAPQLWPGLRDVWMGAGTRPEILLRALGALAWLVRWRLLASPDWLAPLFQRVGNFLRWGEDRGGMFVAVAGTRADGTNVSRAWHLLAEGDNGPFVPAMASASVVLRMLAGQMPAPGARPAVRDHELTDFAGLFAARGIVTGITDEAPQCPLYRRILGDALDVLPEPVRRLHDLKGEMEVRGLAQVERGGNRLARLVAACVGFPAAGTDVAVSVRFTARPDGSEVWTRTFAGRSFRSVQSAGTGRWHRLVCERFGPFSVALAMVREDERLRIVVRHWRFLGLPLPKWLAPGGETFEFESEGRFHFHVEIAVPVIGLIVRYRGWLAQARGPQPPGA